MSKVFISYSSENLDFAEELHRRLKRDGVECFYDRESIAWGENFVRALEKGVDECEYLLIVLSPEYCRSKWADLERTSSMADDPAGLERKLRPLMLKPCRDLPEFPRFLKPIQSMDVSTPETFEKNYPIICREFGGTMKEDAVPPAPDRTKLPPVAALPARHRLPYRSMGNDFTARVNEIWQVHDMLHRDGSLVIGGQGAVMGAGGLGKTQLAIEYAHRYGHEYPGGVYWVEAERGRLHMIETIATAAEIELDRTLPEAKQLERLWRALHGFKPVLIILDNFPEREELRGYLPTTGAISVLITARRSDLDGLRLEFMTPEEGRELLNKGERPIGEGGLELSRVVGGLPLALELMRRYWNMHPELDASGFLARIKETGEIKALQIFAKQYGDELPSGHEKEIAAMFKLSLDQATPAAREVLECLALLAPDSVPRRLVRAIIAAEGGPLASPADDALSELASRLSLVELDEASDPSVHRLIAGYVRGKIAPDAPLRTRTVAAVLHEMKRVEDDKDTASYRELVKILPHAEHILASENIEPDDAISLAGYMGWQYENSGRYLDAELWRRKALSLAEKHHKPGHPSIARTQSNLALALRDLGNLSEAADLLRAALASDLKSFEPGHPEIAIKQSNLALVLRYLGNLPEAEELLRAALASDLKSFEPGHPSIARAQSNLATVLQDLGQLPEAEELLRAALASDLKSYEPGHPSIAITQSNLALVLQDLGNLSEAAELLRAALDSNLKSYEPGHPSIATMQINLGTVIQKLGQNEEALGLFRQAHDAFLDRLGPEHPSTVTARRWLESALGS